MDDSEYDSSKTGRIRKGTWLFVQVFKYLSLTIFKGNNATNHLFYQVLNLMSNYSLIFLFKYNKFVPLSKNTVSERIFE